MKTSTLTLQLIALANVAALAPLQAAPTNETQASSETVKLAQTHHGRVDREKEEEARYKAAQNLASRNRHKEAYRAYLALKHDFYAGKHFPYETEMAEEAEKSGNWRRAMHGYHEALSDPSQSAADRKEIVSTMTDLYEDHASELELHQDFDFLDSGDIARTEGNYAWDLSRSYRGIVHLHLDEIRVRGSETLRSGWVDREDGVFGVEHTIADAWVLNGWIGGSTGVNSDNVLAGFNFKRILGEERSIALEGALNERSEQSLLLEAINGRQNRITIEAEYQFIPQLKGTLHLNGLQYRASDETLGYGFDGDYSLDDQIFSQCPGLLLSFHGNVATFNPSSVNDAVMNPVTNTFTGPDPRPELVRDLISRRVNRHGLALTMQHHITPMLICRAMAGVDYSWDQDSFEGNFLAGFSVIPCKNTEIALDGAYTTAGQGGNSASPETSVSLTFRSQF